MSLPRPYRLLFFFSLLVLLLVGRLAQLQLFQGSLWKEEARRSRLQVRPLLFHRGRILDRRGEVLAEDQITYDLMFRYRDFRRGHPAGQILEAMTLLGRPTRGLDDCLQHAEEMEAFLFALRPADLAGLRPSERTDLFFYFRRLTGLEEGRVRRWAEEEAGSFGEAFPNAREAFENRIAGARGGLLRLEEALGLPQGELLRLAERERRKLELLLRREALRQAAGRETGLSRFELLRKLAETEARPGDEAGVAGGPGGGGRNPDAGPVLLAQLASAWSLEPSRVAAALFADPETALDERLAELGQVLRRVEQAAPDDLAGVRRQLIRDIHARDRRLLSAVPFVSVDRIAQLPGEYPGLFVVEDPRRTWPSGTAPQIVGIAGFPPAAEMEQAETIRREYHSLARLLDRTQEQEARFQELRDQVWRKVVWEGEARGKSGIERALEDALRGERGFVQVLADAPDRERPTELEFRPARNGKDVVLSLDAGLVRAAQEAIQAGYREAASLLPVHPHPDLRLLSGLQHPRAGMVVLDLRDGTLPVLATWPTYAPDNYQELFRHPEAFPGRPQAHRALGSLYGARQAPFPGSTFKPLVAAAALLSDPRAAETKFECRGEYKGLKCDARYGHGWLDLHEALVRSCNIYFYKLGEKLGYDRIYALARRLGFGGPTGIELSALERGVNRLVPPRKLRTSPDRAVRQLAIGQSSVVASPLQMARFFGWLAVGRLWTPRLVLSVGGSPTPSQAETIPLPPGAREILSRALRDVVEDPAGTAFKGSLARYRVAGKTGTAQVGPRPEGAPSDVHSWFVGWFPSDHPRFVAAVFCENTGLHGGDIATHVLRAFLENPETARLWAP
ncbi:MAG: peptidoglycan D,D-transpeptidase FtsI family protein [Planctomycetota bacterium]